MYKISTGEFQQILKNLDNGFSISINERFTNEGVLKLWGRLVCAVPLDYIPMEHEYNEKGSEIVRFGLKRIASRVYPYLYGPVMYKSKYVGYQMVRNKFEVFCEQVGIEGKDFHDVMVMITKDPEWNVIRITS